MSTAAIGSPQQALPEPLTGARADAHAGAFSGAPADALAATLADAIALADAQHDVRAAAQALRERYAPRRIVVVDAFDMRGETPAAVGEKVLWGVGLDANIVTASLKAVISAVNRA